MGRHIEDIIHPLDQVVHTSISLYSTSNQTAFHYEQGLKFII